jgi:hypothetical protein
LRQTFYRTLWTEKVDFLVKKLGAVALNYLYIQEIDPWDQFLVYRELRAILDAKFFPPFLCQIVGHKSHEKGAQLFIELCRQQR